MHQEVQPGAAGRGECTHSITSITYSLIDSGAVLTEAGGTPFTQVATLLSQLGMVQGTSFQQLHRSVQVMGQLLSGTSLVRSVQLELCPACAGRVRTSTLGPHAPFIHSPAFTDCSVAAISNSGISCTCLGTTGSAAECQSLRLGVPEFLDAGASSSIHKVVFGQVRNWTASTCASKSCRAASTCPACFVCHQPAACRACATAFPSAMLNHHRLHKCGSLMGAKEPANKGFAPVFPICCTNTRSCVLWRCDAAGNPDDQPQHCCSRGTPGLAGPT